MNPIKQKYGLTTDQGKDAQSPIWLAMAYIVGMPESNVKHGLLGLCLVMMGVLSYLTVGHKADPEYIDLKKDLQEVLGDGRDN